MDAAKLARLRTAIATDLVKVQRKAVAHVNALYEAGSLEGSATWAEASVRTRASLALVQASLAAERAKTMSEAPTTFNVVMMQARIDDPRQWEAMAAADNQSRAIETTAVPALPAKESGGS